MSAVILPFPPREIPPRLERVAEAVYLMQIGNTPEARLLADRLVAVLRANNYIVPDINEEANSLLMNRN